MQTILVIEDEKGILGVIEAALVRGGYSVLTASDGREGIAAFDRADVDVVITDCIMPHVGGRDVLNHIRGSKRRSTPVIGISGTPWMLQDPGFDAVLVKPFPLGRLLDLLRTLASASGQPVEAAA